MKPASTTVPEPARPYTRDLRCLFEKAYTAAKRFLTNEGYPAPTETPEEAKAAIRAFTLFDWVYALARVISGDTKYLHYRPRRLKPLPGLAKLSNGVRALCGLKPLGAGPKPTEEQRERARILYMMRVFDTQPTAKIAARLARRLGIKKTSDYWPAQLLTLTETPAAFCRRTYYAKKPPEPHPTPAPEPAPQAADTPAPEQAPPFHQRE